MSHGQLTRKEHEMRQILNLQAVVSSNGRDESQQERQPAEMGSLVYGMSSKNVLVVNHELTSAQEDYNVGKS